MDIVDELREDNPGPANPKYQAAYEIEELRDKIEAQAAEIERLRNVLCEIRVYVNEGTFSRQETVEYITEALNEN